MVRVAEKFCTDLYSDTCEQDDKGRERERGSRLGNLQDTMNEIRNEVKGMSMSKADGLPRDLIKEAGNSAINKLAHIYSS